MPSYEIIDVTENGIEIRWDGELTLNHDIPTVMLTPNPPEAAVDQAIQEMYPAYHFQKLAEIRPDVAGVKAKYAGRKRAFAAPLANPADVIPRVTEGAV